MEKTKEEFDAEYRKLPLASDDTVIRAIDFGFEPKTHHTPNSSLGREEVTLFEIKEWLRYKKCITYTTHRNNEELFYYGGIYFAFDEKMYRPKQSNLYSLDIDLPICDSYREIHEAAVNMIFDKIFTREH
jgi:hypothetical protein